MKPIGSMESSNFITGIDALTKINLTDLTPEEQEKFINTLVGTAVAEHINIIEGRKIHIKGKDLKVERKVVKK